MGDIGSLTQSFKAVTACNASGLDKEIFVARLLEEPFSGGLSWYLENFLNRLSPGVRSV
jgi:hypothetical protein